MLRIVERVLGEADVFRRGRKEARLGYELALYRHWSDVEGALLPGPYEIDGHLMGPREALEPLLGTEAPLVVHLDDGRRCRVFLVNLEGAVTGADGTGLFVPATSREPGREG